MVEALALAERTVSFRGLSVLEVGGAIPRDAAVSTGARRWCAGYPEATPSDDGFYEVRAADCRKLPYADATFDAVFSSCALEHVNDMGAALVEIARVMRPGASLVTNFAPIWSCAVGHHLWQLDGDGQRIMFLDPIVPNFAHLLLTEREMEHYLAIVLGSEAAQRCARFIYHDTYINRVLEGEFQRLFRAAGFEVEGLERQGKWCVEHLPSPELQLVLQRKYPDGGDFSTPGFRGVLVKSGGCTVHGSSARRTRAPDSATESPPTHVDRNALLGTLAKELHITELTVTGEHGAITGSPHDTGVLLAYARRGRWAEQTVREFQHLFERDGGLFVDIGANLGLVTLPVAQNPRVQCIAIEPEPRTFRFLIQNVARNCAHSNVQLVNCAVFEQAGALAFELSPDNGGDHRVRRSTAPGLLGEHTWETIEVSGRPLEELVTAVRHPFGVKIDTQGAEPFVIAGERALLAQADLITLEFAPYWAARAGGDLHAVLDFLLESFDEAALSAGDGEEWGAWQPIQAIAEELRPLIDAHAPKLSYWDVKAQKRR